MPFFATERWTDSPGRVYTMLSDGPCGVDRGNAAIACPANARAFSVTGDASRSTNFYTSRRGTWRNHRGEEAASSGYPDSSLDPGPDAEATFTSDGWRTFWRIRSSTVGSTLRPETLMETETTKS